MVTVDHADSDNVPTANLIDESMVRLYDLCVVPCMSCHAMDRDLPRSVHCVSHDAVKSDAECHVWTLVYVASSS